MDFVYTVYGPQGLIGTLLSRDHLVELIQDFEPNKNPELVINNSHQIRAHKTGQLTIIVIQPDPSMKRREKKRKEIEEANLNMEVMQDAIIQSFTRPAPPIIGGYITGSF